LCIEYGISSAIKLWSSSYVNKRAVVRFDYTAGGAPANVEIFTLFDSVNFSSTYTSTPTISYCQKYLIAQGKRTTDTDPVIRVFDLATLLTGGAGDYSDKWLYEWSMQGLVDATHPRPRHTRQPGSNVLKMWRT